MIEITIKTENENIFAFLQPSIVGCRHDEPDHDSRVSYSLFFVALTILY